MINEAIILAGGFGTRLKNIIQDIPKPMAPINDKPFLEYLFNYLIKYNINHVILSVGYRHEVISKYFGDEYKTLQIKYALEDKPLGTGGGIVNAMHYLKDDEAFIINGDTFFNINLDNFYHFHQSHKSELTIALKKMKKFDRYATVTMNNYEISNFHEKKYVDEGYINGGIYACNKNTIFQKINAEKFSFEKDFMEKFVSELKIYGFISDEYFIDIGIPEDYEKAQLDLM
ncbi:MAG: NTP transferase domain-containing protein [Cytophagales bacterium]|nr:NTP transferase domain-containing protein [Cytophagales bacterium]